jgi:hypothetical protein
MTGFVTKLTRRVPLVEQELLTLPENLSSLITEILLKVTLNTITLTLITDKYGLISKGL